MSDDKIRLPQSSYPEVCKILKAYSQYDKPVSLSEVSQVSGIHETIISRNAAFLVSVGLLKEGKSKTPTDLSQRLGKDRRYCRVLAGGRRTNRLFEEDGRGY